MINTGSTPPILPASPLLILYLLIPLIVHPSCPLVLLYSLISRYFLQIRIVLCCCNHKHCPSPRTSTITLFIEIVPHPPLTNTHTLLLCLLPCGSSCKLFTLTPFLPSPPSPCTLISPAQLFFPSSSNFSIILAQQCQCLISSHATRFTF